PGAPRRRADRRGDSLPDDAVPRPAAYPRRRAVRGGCRRVGLRHAGAARGLARAGRLRRANLPLLGGYRAVLAGLAAGPARAFRPGGGGLSRARGQWRRAALGRRADEEWPVHVPEADALAVRAALRGATGRQVAGEGRAAAAGRAVGGL